MKLLTFRPQHLFMRTLSDYTTLQQTLDLRRVGLSDTNFCIPLRPVQIKAFLFDECSVRHLVGSLVWLGSQLGLVLFRNVQINCLSGTHFDGLAFYITFCLELSHLARHYVQKDIIRFFVFLKEHKSPQLQKIRRKFCFYFRTKFSRQIQKSLIKSVLI